MDGLSTILKEEVKEMLLIKIVLVEAVQEVLYMKILEIIHIKILNKTATTQKTCMKNTPTITKMNKVIIMVHLSDNPRRLL